MNAGKRCQFATERSCKKNQEHSLISWASARDLQVVESVERGLQHHEAAVEKDGRRYVGHGCQTDSGERVAALLKLLCPFPCFHSAIHARA